MAGRAGLTHGKLIKLQSTPERGSMCVTDMHGRPGPCVCSNLHQLACMPHAAVGERARCQLASIRTAGDSKAQLVNIFHNG